MDELHIIIYLIFFILSVAGLWKMFEKAGEAGWKAIIPIYNLYIITKIINKPWYWVILMIIPYIGVIWSVWSSNLLAKSFGKDIWYTLGIIFLPFIFYPILGFGDAEYQPLESSDGDIADAMHKAVDDVDEELREKTDEVKESVSKLAHEADERVNEIRKDVADTIAPDENKDM